VNEQIKRYFEQIKFECRPNKDLNGFGDIFDMFFGGVPEPESNFIGGMNDSRNTLHENLFHAIYPYMKPQVHFGTGKDGLEKYHSKRFTVDFYHEENNEIYEIDGTSHKEYIQSLKDKIREYFFFHELGIRTYRITNKGVEELVLGRLEELYKEGVLNV